MTESRDGGTRAKAEVTGELAELHSQAAAARIVLAGLQRDVTEAHSRLGSSEVVQVVEANRQLVLGMLRAQTEAAATERGLSEISRVAQLDALTGLPNRVVLLDRFAQAIVSAERKSAHLALLFLDLNNFKQINDTLGHAAGDDVLKLVARCLTETVRESDTVSRHGGDEFLVLLTEVSQASDAALIADKLIAALGAPSRAGDHVLRLTASIGISVYPDDGEDAHTLIDRADAAMYRAKKHGLGSYVFHGEVPPGERNLQLPALVALKRPLTHYELALVAHEHRHAQLREANEHLVLAAISAQQLQSAAEQAHQQQTEFLAVLAHELRNPLTPIRTAAALLARVGTEELPRMQAIIERQVAHMSRLVGDLLDVARVHTGKLRLECELVDIADVIAEAVDACRPAMDMRLQRLCIQVPARELQIHGDPIRLSQVLCNLLDNASKYTPDGGDVALTLVVNEDQLVITVTDSGIGITAEALPKVFEPFVQDPHATGFNGVGLGIGLTVVRELVEGHGGTVVASSAGPGQGSQFTVTLPLVAQPR